MDYILNSIHRERNQSLSLVIFARRRPQKALEAKNVFVFFGWFNSRGSGAGAASTLPVCVSLAGEQNRRRHSVA